MSVLFTETAEKQRYANSNERPSTPTAVSKYHLSLKETIPPWKWPCPALSEKHLINPE